MERHESVVWITGFAMGAAAMYFLDPRSGRRRRALARDKLVHAARVAEASVQRVSHDAANRAQGTVARATRRLTHEDTVEDHRLEARVRSALGRLTSHPGAIHVEAREGLVILSGPIAEGEIGEVLTGIRRVRGVHQVESHLEAVRDARQVPGLQARRPPGMPPDLLQRHMSPTSCTLMGAAGAALTLMGLRQGGARGFVSAAAGGFMLVRSVTNTEPGRLVGGGGPQAVRVQRTVEVTAPVQEVFAYWSSFRNFPRFMQHLREVRESEGGISHWVADGPGGIPVSWDAEITALKPHQRIAWRSVEGSMVANEGEVRFEEVAPDRTRIHVRMGYNPPAGAVGHMVAVLFGADPRRQIEEDLRRFKALLEEGTTTAHGRPVARRDVQPEAA